MKKLFMILTGLFFLLTLTINVSASQLEIIGIATYDGSDYNLIWDPDNNGKSLVWLDYTNLATGNWGDDIWDKQNTWATELDLTYVLDGYSVEWDDSTWRLPNTVGGLGYDKIQSEMGHLFYTELDNNRGLINTGYFDNLSTAKPYWSGTDEYENDGIFDYAWYFDMFDGYQHYTRKEGFYSGLAVRTGTVTRDSENSVVPEPATMLLFGVGLLGIAGVGRRRNK